MKFNARQKGIALHDIKIIEESLQVKLPKDYVESMLKMNGMDAVGDLYFDPATHEEDINFSKIFPIKYGPSTFEKSNSPDSLKDYPEMQLHIGRTYTGNLSMSVDKDDYGSIHVFYSDDSYKIANSFTEFMEGLAEIDEEDYY